MKTISETIIGSHGQSKGTLLFKEAHIPANNKPTNYPLSVCFVDTILTVGVMNTEGGTGGPVRLLALANEDGDSAADSASLSITSLSVAVIINSFF